MEILTYAEAPKAMLDKLGFTLNQVNHTVPQLGPMLSEAIKRIQYMPFDKSDICLVDRGDKNTTVVWHILQAYMLKAGIKEQMSVVQVADLPSEPEEEPTTYLDSLTNTEIGTLTVRGEEWELSRMPMYLESGLNGLQFVYPIFDWSDLQIWTSIFVYHLEVPIHYFKDLT